jgi:hypothetical protein
MQKSRRLYKRYLSKNKRKMHKIISESDVEEAVIDILKNLGYSYVF